MEHDGKHRMEIGDAGPQRISADHLGRSDISQCGRRQRNLFMERRPASGKRSVEATSRRRKPQTAQAEYVESITRHRWEECLGDDRHGYHQMFRLQWK